LWKL